MEGRKRRTGRPTKRAERGKKASLGLKVTPSIKDKIEAAARKSGRTQSQEAEYRLEQSFATQDTIAATLDAQLGPREVRWATLEAMIAFSSAGEAAAREKKIADWMHDAECLQKAATAAISVFVKMIPEHFRIDALIGGGNILIRDNAK